MPNQLFPVYVINIDRAHDRLADIVRQSQELGLHIERVAGIDGEDITVENWIQVDHDLFRRRHGRSILAGEYGCYRSHLIALQTFLASGYESAIIMEDDISIDGRMVDRALAAKKAAPSAEIIKLVSHRLRGFRGTARTEKGDIIGRCLFGPQGSTACYFITRSGAEKALKSLAVMSLPWDVALERGWDAGISVYSMATNVVGFTTHQRKTLIGRRKDYLAAKPSEWKRIPTHVFRTFEFFRRLKYVLTAA